MNMINMNFLYGYDQYELKIAIKINILTIYIWISWLHFSDHIKRREGLDSNCSIKKNNYKKN